MKKVQYYNIGLAVDNKITMSSKISIWYANLFFYKLFKDECIPIHLFVYDNKANHNYKSFKA